MKKLFTLACGLLLAAQFVSAQTSSSKLMIVKSTSGDVSLYNTSAVDQVSFNDNNNIFNVQTSQDFTSTETSITGSGSVANNSEYSFGDAVEVGVCYSSTNDTPTKSDSYKKLGTGFQDYTISLDNLTSDTQYSLRLCATVSGIVFYGNVVLANTDKEVDIDTHEYVDLGLPSGNLWATVNLGVDTGNEADAGNYYWFGTTDCTTEEGGGNSSYSTDETLKDADDPACILWGTRWHTPSYEDFEELANNCTIEISSSTNSAGESVTGLKFSNNGQSIFLPYAGMKYLGDVSSLNFHGYYMINVTHSYSTYLTTASNLAVLGFMDDEFELSKDSLLGRGSTRPVKKK